jgi:hypothetical protein
MDKFVELAEIANAGHDYDVYEIEPGTSLRAPSPPPASEPGERRVHAPSRCADDRNTITVEEFTTTHLDAEGRLIDIDALRLQVFTSKTQTVGKLDVYRGHRAVFARAHLALSARRVPNTRDPSRGGHHQTVKVFTIHGLVASLATAVTCRVCRLRSSSCR